MTHALVPVTGTRRSWVRDGALVGALSGLLAPVALTLAPFPALLVTMAGGAGAGAVMGALAPGVMEWFRPRTSFAPLLIATSGMASAIGAPVAMGLAALLGAEVLTAGLFGAVVAGTQVTLLLVPYLVATVLQQPRWPIVVGSAVSAATLSWLASVVLATSFSVSTSLALVLIGVVAATIGIGLVIAAADPAPRQLEDRTHSSRSSP